MNLKFHVEPSSVEAKPYTITAVAEYNGEKYTERFETGRATRDPSGSPPRSPATSAPAALT